jgi:transcription termination/antitermination protein NusG
MEDYIGEVLIPTEKVSEVKKGVKTTTTRKFFPGYVLINMALVRREAQLIEKAWYFIRETPGIIGFIGGERPVPLRRRKWTAFSTRWRRRRKGQAQGGLSSRARRSRSRTVRS